MPPFIAMAIGSALGGHHQRSSVESEHLRTGGAAWPSSVSASPAVSIAVGTEVESARIASVILAGGAGTLYLAQNRSGR